jgi:hypothetical protein
MEQLSLPFDGESAQPASSEQSAAPRRRKRLVIDERQATPKRARAISDACVTVKR